MPQKGLITHTDKYEITYTVIDHNDQGQSLPEDTQHVSWWFKGTGCPPYVGTMIDDDFDLDWFFAWSTLPEPPKQFFETHNTEW